MAVRKRWREQRGKEVKTEPSSKVLRFLLEAVCVCIRAHWTWFTPHTRKKLEFEALHNPFLRCDVFATCLGISCRHP